VRNRIKCFFETGRIFRGLGFSRVFVRGGWAKKTDRERLLRRALELRNRRELGEGTRDAFSYGPRAGRLQFAGLPGKAGISDVLEMDAASNTGSTDGALSSPTGVRYCTLPVGPLHGR